MTKVIVVNCVLIFLMCVSSAVAKDVKVKFSIQQAFEYEKVQTLFPGDVSFYWGEQSHPAVIKKIGTFKTSKRTSAFGKDRMFACSLAMASALVVLQDRAIREGGNAVINIVSNIKNNKESSELEFSCLAGWMMVNVALKGTVVTIQK